MKVAMSANVSVEIPAIWKIKSTNLETFYEMRLAIDVMDTRILVNNCPLAVATHCFESGGHRKEWLQGPKQGDPAELR
jgi:hypothetical protein